MSELFGILRFLLRLGWLIPAVWSFSGPYGNMGILLPIYVFLAFGVIEVLLWSAIATYLDRLSIPLHGVLLAFTMAAIAGGAIEIVSLFTTHFVGIAGMILSAFALMGVSLVALQTLDDSSYQSVVSDFRLGVVTLIVAMVFSYAVIGRGHVNFTPPVYFSVTAYVVLGLFSLSAARRFAIDDEVQDDRVVGFQPDWALTTILLLVFVAIFSLVVAQIFAFDVVGGFQSILLPLVRLALSALASVILAIVGAFIRLVQLLGIHIHVHLHARRIQAPKHSSQPRRQSPFKNGHLAPWMLTALKVAILLAGALVLSIVVPVLLRARFSLRTLTLRGERRISHWSWKHMFGWAFRRTGQQLSQLAPRLRPNLRRRGRITSVREAYRIFLATGRRRTRPRAEGETGLEYSRFIEGCYSATSAPLDRLNSLYLPERYGHHLSSPAEVAAARSELRNVEHALDTGAES